MSAMGIRHDEIAVVIGISAPTLRKHFASELDVGHISATHKVAQSLFRSATGDKPNVTAQIFWLKCQAGWIEEEGRIAKVGKKELKAEAAKQVVKQKYAPLEPPLQLVRK